MTLGAHNLMYRPLFSIIMFYIMAPVIVETGILYPKESESREVKSLDGIWHFRCAENSDQEKGFRQKWFQWPLAYTGDFELMPVPSSYNDITANKATRDHIGWVWYQTAFRIPNSWIKSKRRIFLRFGSANHHAVVWLNGIHMMNHSNGYLPFEMEVTSHVAEMGFNNLLYVALNNILTPSTIPQGHLLHPVDPARYPKGYTAQQYNFDYYFYAGIHRPVYLYTTPPFYIDDITITTEFQETISLIGLVSYNVSITPGVEQSNTWNDCYISVRDARNNKVAVVRECQGLIEVPDAKLWWPYLSQPEGQQPGYLYEMEIYASNLNFPDEVDVYRLKFGIRTVESTNDTFYINKKPFYFRGFGRHEDYNVRGKGVDWAMIVKDHNLLKWIGANSYRTSHYPYAEEILDITDQYGIVIIDESPAIGLSGFDANLAKVHIDIMKELVQRDKNRPSVVMWSIGNEPKSMEVEAHSYFNSVIKATRMVDVSKRPVTLVLSQGFYMDLPPDLDVFSINRYYAWYSDTGRLEVVRLQIATEVESFVKKFKKPVLITEYGAGSISGMHQYPSYVWTEDYQVDFLKEYFKTFDRMRKNSSHFIGEMIWNFADFATPQETIRPWGCMKGVFTRDRQPKNAAHAVRRRYWKIAAEKSSIEMPSDLQDHCSSS